MPLVPGATAAVVVDDEERVPERYAVTARFLALRACERFALDPRGWAGMSPVEQAELLVFDRLRREEERRMAEVVLRCR